MEVGGGEEIIKYYVYHTFCSFGSRSFKLMLAFWGNNAQHIGVENVRQNPVNKTVAGAFNQGFLIKVAVFSNRDIITGGINIAGAAIPIREGTTWEMAATAALPLNPTSSPFSF